MDASSSDVEKLLQQLCNVNQEYLSRSRLYDQYHEDFTRGNAEIQLKRQAMEAFAEAVVMFEDQMRLHEKYQREAHRHEINSLMDNYELLKSRLAALRKSRKDLSEDLDKQVAYSRTLDREMNTLKPELQDLYKFRDRLQM